MSAIDVAMALLISIGFDLLKVAVKWNIWHFYECHLNEFLVTRVLQPNVKTLMFMRVFG